ncbi:MAG: protein-export chaperone SecB [Rickettsiales bacterium]|jgi:preprotein translocase subunit SecB|nr:protein-export chaperone SecB [Rickettsiales bacterium]
MTDNKSKNVQLNIISQYIKDLSFENPRAPKSLSQVKASPNIQFNLDVKINDLQTGAYEVELVINAKAMSTEDTPEVIFILELKYAGLFEVQVEDDKTKQQILYIKCPELIYPFARSIVANITTDSGFPPLMMGPINFESIFQSQKNKALAN